LLKAFVSTDWRYHFLFRPAGVNKIPEISKITPLTNNDLRNGGFSRAGLDADSAASWSLPAKRLIRMISKSDAWLQKSNGCFLTGRGWTCPHPKKDALKKPFLRPLCHAECHSATQQTTSLRHKPTRFKIIPNLDLFYRAKNEGIASS
jgi:hypothetical protein